MIVDIAELDERWRVVGGLEGLCAAAARAAVDACGARVADACELSLVLCDDARIAALNAQYRGRARATNVLSFRAGEAAAPGVTAPPLGDVVLAYDTIAREACEQGKTFENHLCHLVVHGVLHLLGYDHLDDASAGIMEGIEIAALAQVRVPNPYDERDE
jgi:probable rRNA maturation factor